MVKLNVVGKKAVTVINGVSFNNEQLKMFKFLTKGNQELENGYFAVYKEYPFVGGALWRTRKNYINRGIGQDVTFCELIEVRDNNEEEFIHMLEQLFQQQFNRKEFVTGLQDDEVLELLYKAKQKDKYFNCGGFFNFSIDGMKAMWGN